MPFDSSPSQAGHRPLVRRDRRAVATWLFAICGMLLVMVALGGATRLTGSGLSIMEWAPLSGALPPLSEAEWQRLFALYQQIPQYALLHEGFGLAGFKQIFWLEWTHRLWGRLLGVVFLVPLLIFWARGALSRALWGRLVLFLGLGALQGAVGWFMVASGFFPDATSVAPVRLVLHLVLALSLYAALLWTALSVLRPGARAAGRRSRLLPACVAAAAVTIVAGGFVAGLHAGLIDNTFPLMEGQIVPPDWAGLSPWPRNLIQNPVAAQFDHRLLATATALLALATVGLSWRRAALRPALSALGGAVLLQYGLGVATLLNAVPVWLGTLHQAGAVLLLTAALVALHADRNMSGLISQDSSR